MAGPSDPFTPVETGTPISPSQPGAGGVPATADQRSKLHVYIAVAVIAVVVAVVAFSTFG